VRAVSFFVALVLACVGLYRVDHHHVTQGSGTLAGAGVIALLCIAEEIRQARKAREKESRK
jgi:hypothetical protein